jgi:hypothetical protein
MERNDVRISMVPNKANFFKLFAALNISRRYQWPLLAPGIVGEKKSKCKTHGTYENLVLHERVGIKIIKAIY